MPAAIATAASAEWGQTAFKLTGQLLAVQYTASLLLLTLLHVIGMS